MTGMVVLVIAVVIGVAAGVTLSRNQASETPAERANRILSESPLIDT